jgi:hypothetical protein
MQEREQKPGEAAGSDVGSAEEEGIHAGNPPALDGCASRLAVSPGGRIRLGYRQGTVESIRGGRGKPYDVRIRWDGESSPVYVVFSSLERDFRAGRLQVLEETEGSAGGTGCSAG